MVVLFNLGKEIRHSMIDEAETASKNKPMHTRITVRFQYCVPTMIRF